VRNKKVCLCIGDAVAKYCGTNLYKKIMDTAAFERGRYRDAIRSGYYGIDEDLKRGKSGNMGTFTQKTKIPSR
jgi:hypothetical protein